MIDRGTIFLHHSINLIYAIIIIVKSTGFAFTPFQKNDEKIYRLSAFSQKTLLSELAQKLMVMLLCSLTISAYAQLSISVK